MILTARAFAGFGLSEVGALHATALVGSIAAVLGAYWLCRRLGGEQGGLLGAFTLALEPTFWFSGITSPTRVYIAAGVCWLLYCLLQLSENQVPFLWGAAGALALFAGFRPELPLFFAVAFLASARLAGISWLKIVLGAALCFAACLPWITWIAASFGSPVRMAYVYYHYFLHHISTTSALLGAPRSVWRAMLQQSLVWNALPATAALLALFLSRNRTAIDRRFWIAAGAYFVPALAVQLVIHGTLDAPDHALGTVTVLWVLAGTLLGAARMAGVAAPLALVMLLISLSPPGTFRSELDILSLRSFAKAQRAVERQLRTLKGALRPGDAVLVLNDSSLSSRVLQYELPETIVVALNTAIQPNPTGRPSGSQSLKRYIATLEGGEISLPLVNRLYVLSSAVSPQRDMIRQKVCQISDCADFETGLRAEIRLRPMSVSLPPYVLRF